MQYRHEQDSNGSPRSPEWISDREYEERSCESKVKNTARDVVYLIKQWTIILTFFKYSLARAL
eukprot:5125807-Prorocentrum_lima.AAC.1